MYDTCRLHVKKMSMLEELVLFLCDIQTGHLYQISLREVNLHFYHHYPLTHILDIVRIVNRTPKVGMKMLKAAVQNGDKEFIDCIHACLARTVLADGFGLNIMHHLTLYHTAKLGNVSLLQTCLEENAPLFNGFMQAASLDAFQWVKEYQPTWISFYDVLCALGRAAKHGDVDKVKALFTMFPLSFFPPQRWCKGYRKMIYIIPEQQRAILIYILQRLPPSCYLIRYVMKNGTHRRPDGEYIVDKLGEKISIMASFTCQAQNYKDCSLREIVYKTSNFSDHCTCTLKHGWNLLESAHI